MSDIIEKLYQDNKSLLDYLDTHGEVSYKTELDNKFKKVLLLSAASYFEYKIMDILANYISNKTGYNEMIISFAKNKAISRQYHTYFKWDSNNANTFWGLFGEEFKKQVTEEIKVNEGLQTGITSFLEIGNSRNILVHQNFANSYLDKTSEEIYLQYKNALVFIRYLDEKFA